MMEYKGYVAGPIDFDPEDKDIFRYGRRACGM